MIALVTGATGFIGGALAAALADLGGEVRVLVRPAAAPAWPTPSGTAWSRPSCPDRPTYWSGRPRAAMCFSTRPRFATAGARHRPITAGPTSKGRVASWPPPGSRRPVCLRQFGRRAWLAGRRWHRRDVPGRRPAGRARLSWHQGCRRGPRPVLARGPRDGRRPPDDHLWPRRPRRDGDPARRHGRPPPLPEDRDGHQPLPPDLHRRHGPRSRAGRYPSVRGRRDIHPGRPPLDRGSGDGRPDRAVARPAAPPHFPARDPGTPGRLGHRDRLAGRHGGRPRTARLRPARDPVQDQHPLRPSQLLLRPRR